MNKKYLIKLSIWLVSFLVFGILIGRFIYTHNFDWQSPVSWHTPLTISKKVYSVITIVKTEAQNPNVSPLTSEQQYLCNKFGADCKTALAVQKAENGSGNCEAINWSNKNQTLDIGYMQINTLYVNKNIFKPSQLFDCKKNIDAAYEIYKSWKGFGAWTTYNNGAYKKFLIN